MKGGNEMAVLVPHFDKSEEGRELCKSASVNDHP
jgi:hypothetical protein